MALFKTCIRSQRADKCYVIYIRVTHNRKVAYIKTDKVVSSKGVKKGEIIDSVVLSDCAIKIRKYIDILNLEKTEELTVQEVVILLFSHFSHKYIEEWLKWMEEKRKCSPTSCNMRLAAMKTFLKYVGSRDITYLYLSQEATLIPKQKTIQKKVFGISKNAVKTLMKMPDTETKIGRRDLALLVLMYGTAARLDEVLSMTVGQLNLEIAKPYATIIGKGSKMRTLYLLPKAVAHIRAYLAEFHKGSDGHSILFYSRNKGKGGKLSQPAIDKQLKKYAKEANKICTDVPLNLHAHQLRHAKASHWLEDGMNILQISFLLGHATVHTTMQYLDVTTEQESIALATLEDEKERKMPKKWKGKENSLIELCGLC